MKDLIQTTILQAAADLLCLSVILYLQQETGRFIVAAYFVTKIVVFVAYRLGGKH